MAAFAGDFLHLFFGSVDEVARIGVVGHGCNSSCLEVSEVMCLVYWMVFGLSGDRTRYVGVRYKIETFGELGMSLIPEHERLYWYTSDIGTSKIGEQ